jgi:hypothetical protein
VINILFDVDTRKARLRTESVQNLCIISTANKFLTNQREGKNFVPILQQIRDEAWEARFRSMKKVMSTAEFNESETYLRSHGSQIDILTGVDEEDKETGEHANIRSNVEKIKKYCFCDDDIFFNSLKLFNYCQHPIITLHRYHDGDFNTPNLSGSVLAHWKCRKWIELMPSQKE